MNLAGKIFKNILAVGISLVLILFIVSLIFETKISGIFTRELNKNLSVPVVTEKLNFSLLKRFPRASLELENLLIKSPSPQSHHIVSDYPDTLLYAEKMILTLKIAPLIKKNYTIDRIDIERGVINICKGSSGRMNTDIWGKKTSSDTSVMNLNINNVNINNSSFTYCVVKTGLFIDCLINNSSNKLVIQEGYVQVKSKSNTSLTYLRTGQNFQINRPYPVKFNTALVISEDSINIGHADIDIDGIPAEGDCIIGKSSGKLSLELQVGNANINRVLDVVMMESKDNRSNYGVDGLLSASINIDGSYNNSEPLFMTAIIDLDKGEVNIPSTEIHIDNIITSARLIMGLGQENKNFEINAQRIIARLDDTGFSGSFLMKNLTTPYIDLIIKGLFPSERITGLFNAEELSSSEGTVRLNARLFGKVAGKTGDKGFNIWDLHRSVNMGLNAVNLELPGIEGEINNIHGNIMLAENIWIDDLSMSYNEQNIALNGMITGFNRWLQKKDQSLNITAGVWSDRIDISSFKDKLKGRANKEYSRATRPNINLNILCDSIIISNFRASLFDGNLSFVPGLLDINSFSMNTLNGTLSGNSAIADLREEGYAMRGWFDIDNIDIREAFSTFNNFSQAYIMSENIDGSIRGNISASATTDRQFKINMKDLVLNGEYEILDGRLVNFEPAYKLSRFIDIDDLAEIEFSKLENELIINNEMITIPRMDISSSAFNISLEGNHSFDGNYEYHLKVLLSELLSKRKNEKVSEFGVIEDDRLGRTSLYLRIIGDKNGSRVTHDTDALRTGLKEDLQREKQTIRSILKEEYGWYRGDTIPEIRTEETRRFRVVWEETDSIKTEVSDTTEKKLPLLRLFKKKDVKK